MGTHTIYLMASFPQMVCVPILDPTRFDSDLRSHFVHYLHGNGSAPGCTGLQYPNHVLGVFIDLPGTVLDRTDLFHHILKKNPLAIDTPEPRRPTMMIDKGNLIRF